eukprot:442979-Amphidinium_carterae.1
MSAISYHKYKQEEATTSRHIHCRVFFLRGNRNLPRDSSKFWVTVVACYAFTAVLAVGLLLDLRFVQQMKDIPILCTWAETSRTRF